MLLERAGSVARLLALPLLTFPLLTFLVDDGNLLRVAVLPYLAIAITLGALWIAESVSRHGQKNEMLAN
jgi:hypothetical protein